MRRFASPRTIYALVSGFVALASWMLHAFRPAPYSLLEAVLLTCLFVRLLGMQLAR